MPDCSCHFRLPKAYTSDCALDIESIEVNVVKENMIVATTYHLLCNPLPDVLYHHTDIQIKK